MCPQHSSFPIWKQPCWLSGLGNDPKCLNPLLVFQLLTTVIGSGMGTWPKMGQSELNSEIFTNGWRNRPLIHSGQSWVWKGGLWREVGNHFSPSKGKLSSGWSRHTMEVRIWRTVENGSQSPTQTLAVEFSDTWDHIFFVLFSATCAVSC